MRRSSAAPAAAKLERKKGWLAARRGAKSQQQPHRTAPPHKGHRGRPKPDPRRGTLGSLRDGGSNPRWAGAARSGRPPPPRTHRPPPPSSSAGAAAAPSRRQLPPPSARLAAGRTGRGAAALTPRDRHCAGQRRSASAGRYRPWAAGTSGAGQGVVVRMAAAFKGHPVQLPCNDGGLARSFPESKRWRRNEGLNRTEFIERWMERRFLMVTAGWERRKYSGSRGQADSSGSCDPARGRGLKLDDLGGPF